MLHIMPNFAIVNKEHQQFKTYKVMKRIFAIVVVALMAATCIFAQSNEPRHEISVSYGAGISLIGDGISNGIGNGIFDSMSGRKWANSKEFGTLGLEYFYHLDNPRIAIGGIATYSQYGEDVIKEDVKEGERTRRYISVMPSVKYYWVNKQHFGLYSKAAAGVMYTTAKSENTLKNTSETDSRLGFMFQASLLGIEGGSQHIRGFIEAGVGEQGILLAGLRYKF